MKALRWHVLDESGRKVLDSFAGDWTREQAERRAQALARRVGAPVVLTRSRDPLGTPASATRIAKNPARASYFLFQLDGYCAGVLPGSLTRTQAAVQANELATRNGTALVVVHEASEAAAARIARKALEALASGKPRRSSARARAKATARKPRAIARPRRNPAAPSELELAKKTFRHWHGFGPKDVLAARAEARIPRTLVKLGTIPKIIYRSNKWDGKATTYEHATSGPQPWLCTGPDGRGLFIVGGNVKVTKRGLVG